MDLMSPARLRQLQERLRELRATAPRVQRFGRNEVGRDFVVGDIHGAFDSVLAAMNEARFDKARDRLFSVGDLIDRGPGSARASRFLQQPYVHANAGNHEVDLVDYYLEEDENEQNADKMVELLARMNLNGMAWLSTTGPEERAKLLEQFAQLPYVMEIDTPRGTVGLVHAEVPIGMDWRTFIAKIEARDEATTESCLTGRQRVRTGNRDGVPGVGRVFAGHDVRWDGAERLGNCYMIDTGGVFATLPQFERGALTLADMVCTTGVLTAAPRPAQGSPHVRVLGRGFAIGQRAPVAPFGDYARRANGAAGAGDQLDAEADGQAAPRP